MSGLPEFIHGEFSVRLKLKCSIFENRGLLFIIPSPDDNSN